MVSAAVNSSEMITNDRRINLATEGLPLYVDNWLRIKTSNEQLTISEYVLSLRREVNPSQNYTRTQIQALVELSESSKQKPFKQLTREDILSFLDKFRKTEGSIRQVDWYIQSEARDCDNFLPGSTTKIPNEISGQDQK
jgi:hypothetical protein